jgi:hypothetical protein
MPLLFELLARRHILRYVSRATRSGAPLRNVPHTKHDMVSSVDLDFISEPNSPHPSTLSCRKLEIHMKRTWGRIWLVKPAEGDIFGAVDERQMFPEKSDGRKSVTGAVPDDDKCTDKKKGVRDD